MPTAAENLRAEIEIRADAATPGIQMEEREDGTWHLWVEMRGQRFTIADQVRYKEDSVFLRDGPADVRTLLFTVRTLQKLVDRALPFLHNHDDRGPLGEGWQSDELKALIAELEALS